MRSGWSMPTWWCWVMNLDKPLPTWDIWTSLQFRYNRFLTKEMAQCTCVCEVEREILERVFIYFKLQIFTIKHQRDAHHFIFVFQALIHGLNRHYYSITINYRKNELEQKVRQSAHLLFVEKIQWWTVIFLPLRCCWTCIRRAGWKASPCRTTVSTASSMKRLSKKCWNWQRTTTRYRFISFRVMQVTRSHRGYAIGHH